MGSETSLKPQWKGGEVPLTHGSPCRHSGPPKQAADHAPRQPGCGATHTPAMHGIVACIGTCAVLHSINLKLSARNAPSHPAQRAAHLGIAAILEERRGQWTHQAQFGLVVAAWAQLCIKADHWLCGLQLKVGKHRHLDRGMLSVPPTLPVCSC